MVSSSGACCRILSWVLNPRGAAHPHSLSICQMWSCCRENEGKELVACNGVTDYAAVVCHCSLISRFCSVQKWTAPHVSLIMLLWFVIVHWYSDSVVFRNGQLHICHLSDFFWSNWSIISRTDFLFNRFLLLSTEMLIVSGQDRSLFYFNPLPQRIVSEQGRSLFYFNPLPQRKLFILVVSLILCQVSCLICFTLIHCRNVLFLDRVDLCFTLIHCRNVNCSS